MCGQVWVPVGLAVAGQVVTAVAAWQARAEARRAHDASQKVADAVNGGPH